MAYIFSFGVWCAIFELTPDTGILSQGGGASDSHSVTLSLYQVSALNVVQYLNTAQFIQCILIKTKETVKFD